MSLSPQISPRHSSLSLYFFLYDQTDYLGFYSVPKPSLSFREFFLKIPNLPSSFSLFKNQTEINMDLSFEEAKIISFEELFLHSLSESGPNCQSLKAKSLNMQKLGNFFNFC